MRSRVGFQKRKGPQIVRLDSGDLNLKHRASDSHWSFRALDLSRHLCLCGKEKQKPKEKQDLGRRLLGPVPKEL